MKKKKLRILKVSIVVIACILLVVAFTPWLFAYMHVTTLKKGLNNPVINSKYNKWYEVSLDENISISLPNEWALIRGEQMQIRNKYGDVIAVGKKVGLYSEDQLEDALRDYYGKEVISFKRVFELNGRYPYFGNGARVQIHLTKMSGDYETKQLFVYLPYEEGKYVFCFAFFADDEKDYSDLYSYVEAIAWSKCESSENSIDRFLRFSS